MIDLRGKRILFTGRLRSFRRSQAQQLATILGAKPVNGIGKNVDILVVGIISKPYDQLLTTQKLTYARTYGIPKIDELAFISWCCAARYTGPISNKSGELFRQRPSGQPK